MRLQQTVTCGCGCQREIGWKYDGRSAKARANALEHLALEAADWAASDCPNCRQRAKIAEFGELLGRVDLPRRWLRCAVRVARLTGGTISRSPKSESVYVTWSSGAWRISDHDWPGEKASLCRSRQGGRWGRRWTSRLTADWLVRELSGKFQGTVQ